MKDTILKDVRKKRVTISSKRCTIYIQQKNRFELVNDILIPIAYENSEGSDETSIQQVNVTEIVHMPTLRSLHGLNYIISVLALDGLELSLP